MKTLVILSTLVLSTQAFSVEKVRCYAEKAVQVGEDSMKADAELSFNLDRETKSLSKVVGHIFVQSVYDNKGPISIEDSYMGFFHQDSAAHNPKYRPNRYKGFTQYKDFNAVHTAGSEEGMWGELVLDLTKKAGKFDARYIFQAGDHMGGTVLLTCRSQELKEE